MGFYTERRIHPVRVLITDSPVRDPDFDFSSFQVGERYEVGPRLADYLIGSRYAVVDRRQAPRDVSPTRDRETRH
jgi:hypothetical protein